MTLTMWLLILLSVMLGAALALHVFWSKKYVKLAEKSNAKIYSLDNDLFSANEQIAVIEQGFKDSQKDKADEYISYISNFLETVADNSDQLSQELELVSSRVGALNESVLEVTHTSEKTDHTSDMGMQHVALVAENLKAFSAANSGLISIQQQFAEVQKKSEAIKFVGEEAEMLALNAAIEAARAGEAGRGFAVVADAMKSLARNSQSSTIDIQVIVADSERKINAIVKDYQSRSDKLNENVKLLLDSFTQIKSAIIDISEHCNQIQIDTKTSSSDILETETTVKTFIEKQVKDLSDLVSIISGVEVKNLTPSEAKSKLAMFDEIIDVRRPEEYNDNLGHIPKSRLSTLQTDFKSDVKKLDKNKSYLFVCRSGGRSTKAAQMAINHGITQVFNFDGGMLAWNGK
jgi:methyl-accepting chemotaxis protein/rhodanese-related sulfurtransferase